MKTYFKKAVAMLISIATIFCVCFVSVNAATTYKTTVKENSFSTIKNVGSGKMLNVYGSKSANNTNVTVYSNDNTNGQKVKATSYNGGYYFTFKCSTSRALNIYGTSCKESANVCIWNLTKNPTQLWIVEYVASKNAYVIRSKSNKDYCLTANGNSNSSNVCIKKYTGSNYQLWTSSLFSAKANTSSNSTTNSTTSSSKTLNINWNNINSTGYQSVSGPCGCYALAYCRDIIDGKPHSWTEYSNEGYVKSLGRYGYSASWGKANYVPKNSTSTSTVYKAVYDSIKTGKPVIVYVTGGRSTGSHYIAIVGYTNVSDANSLSTNNFLIIDSAKKANKTATENMSSVGYSLRKNGNSQYQYIVSK